MFKCPHVVNAKLHASALVASRYHGRLFCSKAPVAPKKCSSVLAGERNAALASSQHQQLVEECSVEDWRRPLLVNDNSQDTGSSSAADPRVVVALGKFDALHRGHQLLAIQAAAAGAYPVLLSFSGMAQVLKWPDRLPLVAPCDRSRVLESWRAVCCGRPPRLRYIPFCEIRHLAPEAFVQLLAKDLLASGVVAGQNYRFGYKAAGDAAMLQQMGTEHGMQVTIVELLSEEQMDAIATSSQDETTPSSNTDGFAGSSGDGSSSRNGGSENGGSENGGSENGGSEKPHQAGAVQVSSSKIRELLQVGDVSSVQQFLGRPYRLVCDLSSDPGCLTPVPQPHSVARALSRCSPDQTSASASLGSAWLSMPSSLCLNQGVGDGVYTVTMQAVPAGEVDGTGCRDYVAPQSLRCQAIVEVRGSGISMPAAVLSQCIETSGSEHKGDLVAGRSQVIRYIMIDLHTRLASVPKTTS